jgi:subtilisin family serine protease
MARVIPIQVFSRVNWSCGDAPAPCAKSFASDQIRALEQVLAWRTTFSIAAVNMSIGTKDQTFASVADCDASNGSTKAAIDNLRSVGIATIISAGNNGDSAGLSAPGCISSAISVGATDKNDNVWSSSNSAPWLSLLAPGVNITSSVPGGSFATMSGTSMAAPHAAGAWAILKQRVPSATVDAILNALQCTGAEILDGRNKLLAPRIRVATALEYLAAGSKPCARLKLYWHDGRQDNFSTATAAGEQDALAAAYGFVRVEGHILRNPEPGTVPLKLFWHGGREDNFSTATAAGEQDALNVGYVGIRNEGYIFSSQRPGTVPLKLYWHAGHGDNFSTATAAGEQAALASGYTFIRVEGYVYP